MSALLLHAAASAQSGVRLIYLGQLTNGEVKQRGAAFGLGYDHDLDPHIAFGVDFTYGSIVISDRDGYYGGGTDINQWAVDYRAYYLAGDNDATSFFIGSHLGLRRLTWGSNKSTTTFPLGLRMGIRGGLPGSFGELFVEGGMQLGGSFGGSGGPSSSLTGAEFRFGFCYGFGWE